jgi:hypothetical protein
MDLKMPEIKSIDLRGKVPDAGAVHFLRAEWKVPQSRFVIVRFALDDKEQPLGVRLDLDKRAILDDVKDEGTSAAVQARAEQIWEIVISYRQQQRETYV